MNATGLIRSSRRPPSTSCSRRRIRRNIPSLTGIWLSVSPMRPGRSLASVIYRDREPETTDLYARFSDWLAGKSS